MKYRIIILIVFLVGIFLTGYWWSNREPAIPLYPNATIISELPYRRNQSVGPWIKTTTLQTSDNSEVVKQWYRSYLNEHWFDTYRSYGIQSDMVYASQTSDQPPYIIGITIEKKEKGTMIVIQLAKK